MERADSLLDHLNKNVIDVFPNGVVIVDHDGSMRQVNEAACDILGYSDRELLGNPIEMLLPERFHSVHTRLRRKYMRSPKPRPMRTGRELFGRKKDGSCVALEIALSPISETDDRCVFVAFVDITSKKELEIAVRERNEVFRHIVENAKDYAILMLDTDGRIKTWNAGAERIKGYQSDEIIGEHFSRFHPKDKLDAGWPEKELQIAVRDGKIEDEGWRIRRDGSKFWANVVVTALYDDAGEHVGFSKITRDLTVRKQKNEALKSLNEELEQFAYIASHDLQEPLRNIIAYSDLLEQDLGENLPADAQEDLRFIKSATGRMQYLIRDLLAYSRAGQHQIAYKRIPLDQCVDEAINVLASDIEESGTTIRRDKLPEITIDSTLVAQLYQNLISNAIKYAGSRPPVIEITSECTNGAWVFGVKDNGIGIKPEYTRQIFAPFKRLHSVAEYEGSGIGLAICKKAVERHGGRIWVTSTPNVGSKFHFTLPNTRNVSNNQRRVYFGMDRTGDSA